MLIFESPGITVSIRRQVFSFLHCSNWSGYYYYYYYYLLSPLCRVFTIMYL